MLLINKSGINIWFNRVFQGCVWQERGKQRWEAMEDIWRWAALYVWRGDGFDVRGALEGKD